MTEIRWDLRRFATLPSTNDWLLDEARAGTPAGTVVVAGHQRAGKGRLGRRWEAPPGTSLLVSVLLRPLAPAHDLYPVTAAVALAAADACDQVAGVAPEIKWPNDLLVGERKLAGVLAESDTAAIGGRPGSVAVVVGLGCNVNWNGPDGATSLCQASGRAVELDALLQAYLAALALRAGLLDEEGGRRSVVDELRRRCTTLGRAVRVTTGQPVTADASGPGNVELTGVAVAIDDHGRLLVDHTHTRTHTHDEDRTHTHDEDSTHTHTHTRDDHSDGCVTAVAAGDVVHLRQVAPGRPEHVSEPG
jgi:BirA family transcriptional regulator, biotin operon repressor / biotin---[acetyl-CoA-carboxylase] ligase